MYNNLAQHAARQRNAELTLAAGRPEQLMANELRLTRKPRRRRRRSAR